MPKQVFAALNMSREEQGRTPFANPRNAAAGSLRQLDSSLCAARKLELFVFNLQEYEHDDPARRFSTHAETLEYLNSCGFTVSPVRETAVGMERAAETIRRIGEMRTSLGYDIDGAVVKVNDLSLRKASRRDGLGTKWAVAFKYPPETAETTLTDIVVQVGRTGVLTPKALLDPGARGGQHRLAGYAAQRRLHRLARHPHRRSGTRPQGGRHHPRGHRAAARQAKRQRAGIFDARRLPLLRRAGHARRRRGGRALWERLLPGAIGAYAHTLRLARRDEHRGTGREHRPHPAERRPDPRRSGALFTENCRPCASGGLRRKERLQPDCLD